MGALLTLLFAALATAAGLGFLRAWLAELDPAERIGVAGLATLGLVGLATLAVGALPSGLRWGWAPIGWALLVGAGFAAKRGALKFEFTRPEGLAWLAPVWLALLTLIPLAAVLAPSGSDDWDSLAYHLAVPKLWLREGQIGYVPALHHSNFPFTVDNLFIWGQAWGGQHGAKAFMLATLILGLFAVFGLCRRWYGKAGGWWGAVGLAGMPVVLWESGTAYIDVAHGLYAALACAYAAEAVVDPQRRERWLLGGLLLGLTLGSKFTGLQVALALGLVVLVGGAARKQWAPVAKGVGLAALVTLIVGGAWYARNTIQTGNPVYPFLYSVLGGREWDEWRAAIYRNEQQTFGVGRTETGRDPSAIGHAVLGLAYQPGRFVNPGQEQGQGMPTGALGFAVLLGGALAAASGRFRGRDALLLAMVGVGFLLWFFLSQQSRYLTILAIPLAVLSAGAVVRLKLGPLVAGAIALQSIYTGWLLKTVQTDAQLLVVSGRLRAEEYQRARIGFWPGAQAINALPADAKVALYDEVFGYLLDRRYMWANPGHSTLIPYERMASGADLASSLAELGFTHAYVNLQFQSEEFLTTWLGAMGLQPGEPFLGEQREAMMADLNLKWKVLVAEAAREGRLRLVEAPGRGLLFEVVPGPSTR